MANLLPPYSHCALTRHPLRLQIPPLSRVWISSHSCSWQITDKIAGLVAAKSAECPETLAPPPVYLISHENWRVRRMVETQDTRDVAFVQAEAFHEPVLLFDHLFFEFFKAEVLSGLMYRLRNSPPDRYACLVVESIRDTNEGIVGVVDVTAQGEGSILQHLQGVDEYLYVSGIAVLRKFRRQGAATALLEACDVVCTAWGFRYLVLRVYEDDYGAQNLYSRAGYRIISRDPPWVLPLPWIGTRRRVVMAKKMDKPENLK